MAHVTFLQCELEHRHQAPHLAMCLYASDLQRAGHRVDKAMVHPSALDEAAAATPSSSQLLVLDAIFPFGMIRRLQRLTNLPVLVGGHNALQHMLRGPADFAIVGPGRQAISALLSGDNLTRLLRGDPPEDIPNLWWRGPDGQLDCSGHPASSGASLDEELDPFTPDWDWDYFGPPRAPASNLRIPSVIADFGCVWNRSILNSEGAHRPYATVSPRLPDVPMTSRAAAVLQSQFIGNEGGCSFCVLRYAKRTSDKTATVIASVVEQARVHLAHGAHGLSLQTEHPLPFLGALLDALDQAGLSGAIDALHIRTIPWLVLRHRNLLEEAIVRSKELGIQLVLAQVGFEAFDALSLEIFHKGLSSDENRTAARLLTELTAQHGPHFLGTGGHGLIPLHPWTRPEDLRTNLAACRSDAPWLLPAIHPTRRVELYAEWTPLFWKAQDEGLLRPAPEGFGWDWDFADEGTDEIVTAAAAILANSRDPSADVLDAVLRIWESGAGPEERRARYLELRT
jgi:hypothetical protein